MSPLWYEKGLRFVSQRHKESAKETLPRAGRRRGNRFNDPLSATIVRRAFSSPFVAVPGRFMARRFHTDTHGSIDAFIVAAEGGPAWIHVNSILGASWAEEWFPECPLVRLQPNGLVIEAIKDGFKLKLDSPGGPVIAADVEWKTSRTSMPYWQDEASSVSWGSVKETGHFLVKDAVVSGKLSPPGGDDIVLNGVRGFVSRGSFSQWD